MSKLFKKTIKILKLKPSAFYLQVFKFFKINLKCFFKIGSLRLFFNNHYNNVAAGYFER